MGIRSVGGNFSSNDSIICLWRIRSFSDGKEEEVAKVMGWMQQGQK